MYLVAHNLNLKALPSVTAELGAKKHSFSKSYRY